MPESLTFSYTGAVQTWVVPTGVFSVTLECWGAEGGRKHSSVTRRYGGYAKGNLAVTPGETLRFYVGQYVGIGNVRIGGWNGGGNGGLHLNPVYSPGMDGVGGGGATDVRQGGTALSNRVIVAAGAGGQTSNDPIANPPEGIRRGGHGGAATGERGDGNDVTTTDGNGGTQTEGGTLSGALGVGGDGQPGDDPLGPTGSGGGGGGGYYGGGGGSRGDVAFQSPTNGRGGGGGSNYVGGVTSSISTRGVPGPVAWGDGQVILEWVHRSVFSLFSGLKAPIYGGDGEGVTIYLPNGNRL